MIRPGRRSARLAALVAALSLAMGGLPRSPLVEHEHEAGDRLHRHAGGESSGLAEMLAAVAGHAHGHDAAHGHAHGHADGHVHAIPHDHADRAVQPRRHAHGGDVRPSPGKAAEPSATASPQGDGIEAGSSPPTRHAHWSSTFDLAARSAAPVAVLAQSVHPAAAAPAISAERVFAGRLRARSPPSVAL